MFMHESVNGEPFGAIVYVKKIMCDFKEERETLNVISRQIAVAIQNARKFETLSHIPLLGKEGRREIL